MTGAGAAHCILQGGGRFAFDRRPIAGRYFLGGRISPTTFLGASGEGATAFVEFGPGNVLTGLTKRILAAARTANVSDETTLREALPVLR